MSTADRAIVCAQGSAFPAQESIRVSWLQLILENGGVKEFHGTRVVRGVAFLSHLMSSSMLKTSRLVQRGAQVQTSEPQASSAPSWGGKLHVIGEIVAPVKGVAFTVYTKL